MHPPQRPGTIAGSTVRHLCSRAAGRGQGWPCAAHLDAPFPAADRLLVVCGVEVSGHNAGSVMALSCYPTRLPRNLEQHYAWNLEQYFKERRRAPGQRNYSSSQVQQKGRDANGNASWIEQAPNKHCLLFIKFCVIIDEYNALLGACPPCQRLRCHRSCSWLGWPSQPARAGWEPLY